MAQPIHIAGTGSFAAEVAAWAADAGRQVAGLIEMRDPTIVGATVHEFPVVGLEPPPLGGIAVLGLGGDREEGWRRLARAGWSPGSIVHPTAHVGAGARLGAGATVGPHAVVGAAAAIGEQAILSRGTLVGHHTRIGDFATLNPGVNVGGNSEIGAGAFLGIGSVVVNGIAVGAGATVAAGAVAIRDVPVSARVQGVPATEYRGA